MGLVTRRARVVRSLAGWVGAVVLACGSGGCREKPPAYVPPPPPDVTVAAPVEREIDVTLEETGTTRGIETVEVRARVRGFIDKKFIKGGERVESGQPLYRIDPRPFEAARKQAEAERDARAAALRLAEVTLERVLQASRDAAVSKQEVDKATADRDAAKAQVDLAEALLTQAKLDLEWTEVTSPIAGRLGMNTVDTGQLVGATEPTLLATVVNDDIIYARYSINERQLLQLRRANQNRRPGEDGRGDLVIRMGLAGQTDFPFEGKYARGDNALDPSTGTIGIEAEFANADGTILPGLFVRLKAMLGKEKALLVPDVAVQQDQGGRYVLVVNDKDVAERRNVRVGPVVDRMRPILADEGGGLPLSLSDRVIVNGIQRARPGAPVKPTLAGQTPPGAPQKPS